MRFFVRPLKGSQPGFPYVALQRDSWDDYGYKTTFSATLYLSAEEVLSLGTIKILNLNQQSGQTLMPEKPFTQLGPSHCSVGADLEYYEKIFKLGEAIYRPYLDGISDAAYSDEIRATFEDQEGYRVSLMRFVSERTMVDAPKLFASESPVVRRGRKGFVVKFKTTLAEGTKPILIDFDFRKNKGLPHRMNVLIGYNGTGKTRLLSNLAITASGYGYDRKKDQIEKSAGRFVGDPPPFKAVVVVSYSAFDTFVIPGKNKSERERLREDGGIFGYVYCGLRERARIEVGGVKRSTYRLKSPEEIETEFLVALNGVREACRQEKLIEAMRPLLQDASFQRIGLTSLWSEGEDEDESAAKLFGALSSGHKVVLKIIVELTAHLDDSHPALVLIDEPETHLHPPLLAAFLRSIRVCLEQFDAYAIISTHSPVVLQESPARYVRILRRAGDLSRVDSPSTETFGENIGVITSEVFNLDDGSTDWHETLAALARRMTLEQIEALFGKPLGFVARSHVVSLREENGEGAADA